jgi:hypothetical protein
LVSPGHATKYGRTEFDTGLAYLPPLTAADEPTEFDNVTATLPRAALSPVSEKGTRREKRLPLARPVSLSNQVSATVPIGTAADAPPFS